MLERVRCAQVRDKGSVVELGQRKCVNVCLSVYPCRLSTRLTPATCWGSTLDTKYPPLFVAPRSLFVQSTLFQGYGNIRPRFSFFRDTHSFIIASFFQHSIILCSSRGLSTSPFFSNTRLSYALHQFSLLLLLILAIDHHILTGLLCFFFGDKFGTPQ